MGVIWNEKKLQKIDGGDVGVYGEKTVLAFDSLDRFTDSAFPLE